MNSLFLKTDLIIIKNFNFLNICIDRIWTMFWGWQLLRRWNNILLRIWRNNSVSVGSWRSRNRYWTFDQRLIRLWLSKQTISILSRYWGGRIWNRSFEWRQAKFLFIRWSLRGFGGRTHFHCKNSRDKKSGEELSLPFINSILKSKLLSKACHLAKICFEIIFLISFSKIGFADWQSILNKNDFMYKSSSNFLIHKTILKTSFLTVE